MTADPALLVVCPADGCRLSNFYVTRDPRTREVTISCSSCGNVLMVVAQGEMP